MATTEHMCGAGYKWFEHYSPFFVGVGALVSVLACRRTVVGVTVAMLIGGVFDFVVCPEYRAWIHGPNAPITASSGSATRILQDLRLIEEESASRQAKPANGEAPQECVAVPSGSPKHLIASPKSDAELAEDFRQVDAAIDAAEAERAHKE
jgi:hypothetical protein